MLKYKNVLSILIASFILFAAAASYGLTVNCTYDDLHRLTKVERVEDRSSLTYTYEGSLDERGIKVR